MSARSETGRSQRWHDSFVWSKRLPSEWVQGVSSSSLDMLPKARPIKLVNTPGKRWRCPLILKSFETRLQAAGKKFKLAGESNMQPNTQLFISIYSDSVTSHFRGLETKYQSLTLKALEISVWLVCHCSGCVVSLEVYWLCDQMWIQVKTPQNYC